MAGSRIVLASALSLALLGSCGRQSSADADNGAFAPETDAPGNAAPADPSQPPAPAANDAGTVPPPDAVSHPGGYLPNAADAPSGPGEAEADPPAEKAPPPATEDEYIRNRQTLDSR